MESRPKSPSELSSQDKQNSHTQQIRVIRYDDFLDADKVAAERDQLKRWVNSELDKVNTIFLRRDKKTFNQLWAAPNLRLISAGEHLHRQVEVMEDEESSDREKIIASALQFGAVFVIDESIDQILHNAARLDLQNEVHSYLDVLSFYYAGSIHTKIAGISLHDLFYRQNQFSSSQFLRYMVESFSVFRDNKIDDVMNENSSILKSYPNHGKVAVLSASTAPRTYFYLPKQALERELKLNNGIPVVCAQKAVRLAETVKKIQAQLYDSLFDPSHPDFSTIKSLSLRYIESGPDQSMDLLQAVGVLSPNTIRQMYTQAKEHYDKGIEPEFYNTIINALYNYIDFLSPQINLLSKNDLPMIVEDVSSDIHSDSKIGLDHLIGIAKRIQGKSGTPQFEINPNELSWNGFVAPDTVSVELDRNRPGHFRIILHYSSDIGEHLDVRFDYNSKSSRFQWTFIESPDELNAVYKLAIQLGSDVLGYLDHFVDQKTVEKIQLRIQKSQESLPTSPKSPRVRPVQEPVRYRTEPPKPLTPVEEALLSSFSYPEQIKKDVSLPEFQEFKKLCKDIESKDIQLVLESINEFKQRGVGEFKHLTGMKDEEGNPIYSLRVTSTVAEVRVLMVEKRSVKNRQNFVLYEIGYRKDIYRKKRRK